MTDKALFAIKLLVTLAIIAAIAAFGVSAYNAGWAYAEEETRQLLPICEVNVHSDSSLRVRQYPSTDSRVLHYLADGHELVVIQQYNGWALVNSAELYGVRDPLGWVHADYLLYTHKNIKSK